MPRDDRIAALSSELAMEAARSGEVTWTDDRARSVLGEAILGRRLGDLAVPGTSGKIDALLSGGMKEVEAALVVADRPVTFSMRAEATEAGMLVVARRVGEAEAVAFQKVTDAMSELVELHRDADRQRRELMDSNRALMALHGELDDKNEALRHAADVKTRVVANVSHEFRTPINSMLGITQLLLDRLDGELTEEQEKQLRFVRSSAEALSDLVNDLLDLSRIEAGRHDIRAEVFDPGLVLSSLRGMMRPLSTNDSVELVVEDAPPGLPQLNTDRGKIGQILRNLVSNALKFTAAGEIRVRAEGVSDKRIRFTVSDTGIGIAEEDRERVFDEFTQIDNSLQRKVRGTGLGLSLSRRLAELLGGTLQLSSEIGKGSTFTLEVPVLHEEVATVEAIAKKSERIDPSKTQVLVVEDNRKTLFLYERYLAGAGFQVIPARSVEDAKRALERCQPAAIVLDVMLEGEATWSFLSSLKDSASTRDIPVMVVTVVDRAQKARALGADEFWLKPVDGGRLARKLAEMARRGPVQRVLVIDDDEASRYLMKKILTGGPYTVYEAADGEAGVALAREHKPHVIFLDFILGANTTAFDVIDDLKADPATRNIPVIIQTSKTLDEAERVRLERETAAILNKQSLSRELAISRIRAALEGR